MNRSPRFRLFATSGGQEHGASVLYTIADAGEVTRVAAERTARGAAG